MAIKMERGEKGKGEEREGREWERKERERGEREHNSGMGSLYNFSPASNWWVLSLWCMAIVLILLFHFWILETFLSAATSYVAAGPVKDSDSAKDSKQLEAELQKSELWTTVFRGGYAVKQLERSFSGRHVCGFPVHTYCCLICFLLTQNLCCIKCSL